MVNVDAHTGKIGKYGKSHLKLINSAQTGEGKYRRVKAITTETDSYSLSGHGFHDVITPSDFANNEMPFIPRQDLAKGLTTLVKMEREVLLANVLTDTSVITQNVTLTGTDQFSDITSDPLSVFNDAQDAIEDSIGIKGNLAILDSRVIRRLKIHPSLLSSLGFKDNRPGGLTMNELASVLDVDRILVSNVRYDSANEGQTTAMSAAWGKHIIFMHAPMTAAPYQQSAGYCFQKNGMAPNSIYATPIDNPPNSEQLLIENWYSDHINDVGAIFTIKDAIA